MLRASCIERVEAPWVKSRSLRLRTVARARPMRSTPSCSRKRLSSRAKRAFLRKLEISVSVIRRRFSPWIVPYSMPLRSMSTVRAGIFLTRARSNLLACQTYHETTPSKGTKRVRPARQENPHKRRIDRRNDPRRLPCWYDLRLMNQLGDRRERGRNIGFIGWRN